MKALDYALTLIRAGVLSVDQCGRIWRHFEKTRFGVRPVERRRAESLTRKGYLVLVLGVPGERKTFSVGAHRVVWTLFNGPIPVGLQINHKDLDKANNRLRNLEVVTGSGNIQHSYANGRRRPWSLAREWRRGRPVTSVRVRRRIIRLRSKGETFDRIALAVGLSKTHVCRICKKGGTN